MKLFLRTRLSVVLLVLWGGMSTYAGDVSVTREGRASSVILISQEKEASTGVRSTPSTVEGAVEDLKDYIQKISGAELEVRRIADETLDQTVRQLSDKGTTAIIVGKLAMSRMPARESPAKEALTTPDAFAIHAADGVIAIAGGNARGAEIGVHALLEQVGVRWFFPGELGTVVPKLGTITVREQDTAEAPSFAARQFQLQGEGGWSRYQRTGGRYFSGAHGIPLPKGIDFNSHPEIYALVKGKRQGPQLCLSNPDTLKFAVARARQYFKENPQAYWYGMGPEDKSGFCECEGCKALDGGDWDAFSGEPSVTDRYLWFFNQVLDNLKDEYPDKKIAFYIYHSYMKPPVRIKPHPNIVGAIAPIGLCRVHGMSNPVCPERSYLKKLVADWKGKLGEVYERGYWFNLADPGMWFVQTSRLKDEIGSYKQYGITGFRTECMGNWAVEGPSLYIAGRLMWDANADTEALLGDFCSRLFGPAAKPMRDYFSLIDQRLRESDHHTGSAFNITQFFPPEVRKTLGRFINEAMSRASGTPNEARVAVFSRGHAYADAFAKMREAQARQDWNAAHASLEKMDRIREELVNNYNPPLLNPKFAKSFLDRFFRLPVTQGWARASQNLGFVPLSNSWSFQIDPSGVGESIGYQRKSPLGGNWQSISTTQTWSDQGLRYYKGFAWYRQDIQLSENLVGKRVFLWFGGVDETARVWVNGQPIGNSPRSAFTPFELDVSNAVAPGLNTIAVCVANRRVDELGSGGLIGPAFLYAPTKGDAAELENIKPLTETFP